MKISFRFFAPLFLVLSVTLASCDSSNDANDSENNTLYVKFSNNPASEFTITDIQLAPMGKVEDNNTSPTGDWNNNILTGGKTLAPGDSTYFTLNIPNLHWSKYRLGVVDENSAHLMLHEQTGYTEWSIPSITHWGSDDRTVSVAVVRNKTSDLIEISGWSDWAGID